VPDIRLELVMLDVELREVEEQRHRLAAHDLCPRDEIRERDLRDIPHRRRLLDRRIEFGSFGGDSQTSDVIVIGGSGFCGVASSCSRE
jgi:hypothetical protein